MMTATSIINLLVTAGLLLAVYFDLRTRKFENRFFLLYLGSFFAIQIALNGLPGVGLFLMGSITAIALLMPFYILKVIGAGDVKLMIAISSLLSWKSTLSIILFSFIWGALLGLIQVILKRELLNFAFNLKLIFNSETRKTITVHKIPFTVALLLGWLSQLTLMARGIQWPI